MNDILGKIDVLPGGKTTVGAFLLLAVSVLKGLEVIDGAQFTMAATWIGAAFGVTLAAKAVRNVPSGGVSAAGLAVGAAAATALVLGGCALSIGDQGKYVRTSLANGFCTSGKGLGLEVQFGLCGEQGESVVFEGSEDVKLPPVGDEPPTEEELLERALELQRDVLERDRLEEQPEP